MYLSLKNPTAPEFLNAAAAAAGMLQLSVNSITDIRKREILPRITFLSSVAGAACLFLAAAFTAANSSIKDSLALLFFDGLKKSGGILLLLLLARISRGGIGWGDIRSLCSLACCCSFSIWAAAMALGFLLAFFPAAALFLMAAFRHLYPSVRRRSLPFIPFLLIGFLLSFFIN